MTNSYSKCFACGKDNSIGLKLNFSYSEQYAISKFKLSEEYCGYPNVVHGGIIGTILDEAMAKIIIRNEDKAVTHGMITTYKKPVRPITEYEVKSKIISIRRKIIKSKATITDENGKIYAEAEATFFRLKNKEF